MVKKTIYVLLHPKSHAIRYVGATVSALAKRLALHVAMADKNTSKCAAWVRALRARGLRPVIKAVSLPVVDWEVQERAHVKAYRFAGCRLLNMTEGGMGCHGCRPADKTRVKRSATLKARYADDPAQMKARQELMRKAARSPQARAAASARMTRIWSDPKLAAEMRGRMKSAKARKVA
jgi:hypothetical protein